MSSSESSTGIARGVVAALIEAGIREIVLAPGSRNAPLSFAVYDAAAAGLVRLHTRIDERSAAFLALGLTKTGSRAAVMCTSGTAVANLHPAMLEAAHAGVPMVAVTADRPASLRGTGANQTTDQIGVFGPLIPTTTPTVDELWRALGPVHWNVPLAEPLTPEDRWSPTAVARDIWHPPEIAVLQTVELGPRTVVVAGDDAGPRARQLAEAAGWPLLAEPSSGARTGENAIRSYRLQADLLAEVERAVVFGHPTLSRPISALLSRCEVIAAPVAGVWAARPFPVARQLESTRVQVEPDGPAWLQLWRDADRETSRELDRLPWSGPVVAATVARALAPGQQLYVGPSNPIRDLDLAPPWTVGERRKVLANRGLAGIDGVVSSAIGAALGRPHATTVALMGDVTFLHDSNGLVLGPDEPRPDLQVVVVNDDGGSIFATLEQGASAYDEQFERLFGTPHHVDLEALCAATRTPHLRVGSVPELEQALANPNGGIEVIEVRIERHDRRALDGRVRSLGATH